MTATTHAQTDVSPPSAARALSCLTRPGKPPVYPELHRYDRESGLLRVLLHFDKPDAAPRVGVLANSAREDMQDEVFSYLSGYRLPCLRPEDGVVDAVQEFHFTNSDAAPIPTRLETDPTFCVVMPRRQLESPDLPGKHVQHVVLVATFKGGAEQPPDISVIYSTAQDHIEKMVRDYVAQYRMPCRSGSEQPRAMQQQFTFIPNNASHYVLKRDAFDLVGFLALTKGIKEAQADFDFNTMGCPFKLSFHSYTPLPNEVNELGKPDVSRTVFLNWLQQRQIAFRNEKQTEELFGSRMQIDVPCGRLLLQPKDAEPKPAAS